MLALVNNTIVLADNIKSYAAKSGVNNLLIIV